jgi:hypothetical protein
MADQKVVHLLARSKLRRSGMCSPMSFAAASDVVTGSIGGGGGTVTSPPFGVRNGSLGLLIGGGGLVGGGFSSFSLSSQH